MIRLLQRVALLAAGLLFVWAIETGVTYAFRDQTLAPLLSILVLVAFVFIGSPRLILVGIPFFAVLTFLLIKDSSKYPFIRTTTMVLGGFLAYWAARQKYNLEERLSEIDVVLSKIKTPWILCDRSGNIRRMSTPAAQIARSNFKDLKGTSFFSKFSGGPSRGELIQKFLQAADSHIAVDRVGLSVADQAGSYADASFIPIQTKEGTGILVILSPSSPS